MGSVPRLIAGMVLLAALLGASACGEESASTSTARNAASEPKPPIEPEHVERGCGGTSLYKGANPEWTASARPPEIPYAIGRRGTVAAFLFARPLRAGHPHNPSNKILWVVRLPREGHSLRISGHPLGSPQPTVRYTNPSDSGPGEIYPSTVDVPKAGCWRFTLSWAAHTDRIDLAYQTR